MSIHRILCGLCFLILSFSSIATARAAPEWAMAGQGSSIQTASIISSDAPSGKPSSVGDKTSDSAKPGAKEEKLAGNGSSGTGMAEGILVAQILLL